MAKSISYSKHPKEMYLLALVEMCQRFAFWGVGNLLVLYLVQSHAFADAKADQLYGAFAAVAFILPVAGGYVADKLGYKLPVLAGCIASALGCFFLATGLASLIYPALILVAVGAGVFTPSIYTLLGRAYEDRHHLREGGFSLYYCAVNIGVFLAMFILGFIGQNHGWSAAFATAGVIQLIGILPFIRALNNPVLSHLPVKKETKTAKRKAHLKPYEKKRILVICVLAFFSILFWISYTQGGSSLSLFALRYTDRNVLGFQMPPSWLLSSESLYLVVLAFPLTALYARLARMGKDPAPPVKSALGFFAMAICFLIVMVGAQNIPLGATQAAISPFYLLTAYLFMALAEMLITPIGLSLVTHISPRQFTGLLVGVWYCCIGIGFYVGGMLAGLMSSLAHLSSFFSISVIISLVPFIVLLLLAKKLNQMRHMNSL